ncbi:MAG: type VI secretion system membrane subunit TssM, partial [Pyrinomonadaceae bacterium]|nr:type VI secretion system membrane subunit TssM [Pyrinomonadaceae bacterium]
MNRQYYMNQMKFLLGFGGIMTLYGGAGFIVYFGGQYLGFRPSTRVVIIALLLITAPFVLFAGWFSSRKKKKLEAAKETEDAANESEAPDSKPVSKAASGAGGSVELGSGADEVVKFLKSSDLGSAGKEAVYSLPWYLVIGGPGSGKTSLVLSSGLDFQTLPSQRQAEQNLIKPTSFVDWRVTSEAVFVDTAGRFQKESDADEWTGLVDTIKKFRPKRPLDGLILSVNTELILNTDERELEAQAKAIRSRLDEATKKLKTRYPVYLVFTHADAIEGFRDSFSESKKDNENLVWGSTIPLEKSDNAQSLFDSEYEVLQESVMRRRLFRLSAPFSPVRQLRIFNFPLHFGSARRKLGSFVSTLFRPNPFSESPFLRGFYFTASPAKRQRGRGRPGKIPRTLDKQFFTKKLFRDVILRDKNLVRTFYEQKQKPPIMGWLLTSIAALLVLTLLGLSGLSLYNNKRLVDDAEAAGKDVMLMVEANRSSDGTPASTNNAQEEIDRLEALRKQLERLDEWDRDGAPYTFRFGLYSGTRLLRERLMYIYYVGIEKRFRQPTKDRIIRDLEAFAKSGNISSGNLTPEQEQTLEKHYDLLKAYLMLTEEYKEFSETTTLTSTLENIWISEAKLPPGNEMKAKAQLEFYFKQVDRDEAERSKFPRFAVQKTLVDNVRKKLEAFPAYIRYLKLSVAEVSKEIDPVTVDSLLQGRSKGVLSGTHAVPGAYTMEGFRKFMKQSLAEAATKMNKDDWVMGKKDESAEASADDLADLEEKYYNEYTDHWRKLIRETTVPKYESREDLEKTLGALSDTESPMKILLRGVSSNTDFSTKSEEKGWFDLSWIDDWWSGSGQDSGIETKNVVQREFGPLFRFVEVDEEEDKDLPISSYGSVMKDLYEEIGAISAGQEEAISAELIKEEGKRYRLIRNSENEVNNLTEDFNSQAGKEVAALLKTPVNAIRAYFGKGAQNQLEADWTNRILPKARQIENGYPFTSTGEADMINLAAFLNPNSGELSKFFKENLERYFEEVEGTYRVKQSSDLKFSPAFVAYINNAFKLRRTLFGSSETPNYTYDFRLMPVDQALIEISIDGQTVTSDQTGSKKLKFPASSGANTGVLMRFSSTESGPLLPGTVPTPGSSANTNTSTVSSSGPAVLRFQDSGTDVIRHQGTWGLFKFFESGSPKKQSSGEYLLTYNMGGKQIQATIKPTGGDLFDLSIFRNLKAPDRMQN